MTQPGGDHNLGAVETPMRIDAEVSLLDLGGRFALFHERRQELVQLNDAAAHIWRSLAAGLSPREVAHTLTGDGADPAAGRQMVATILQAWLEGGWMTPHELDEDAAPAPLAKFDLSVLDIGMRLEVFGAPAPQGLADMLAPLRTEGAQAPSRLEVAAWQGRYLLRVDGRSRGMHAPAALAPAVKAAVTERMAALVDHGFLGHGALVARGGRRIFLAGRPGAGKSTLALALEAAGFDCLSDDIVQVDERGWMRGAPFAPAVKSGAWNLLAGSLPGLETLPVHQRADGQQVRYAPLAVSHGPYAPLDVFVILNRQPDGPTQLTPRPALDAFHTLLDSAYAAHGRLSGAQATSLAAALGAAVTYELRYAGLGDVVERVRGLADG